MFPDYKKLIRNSENNLPGKIKIINTANIPSKQARKAIGIVSDFSVFLS
jgi:hypothetical protein